MIPSPLAHRWDDFVIYAHVTAAPNQDQVTDAKDADSDKRRAISQHSPSLLTNSLPPRLCRARQRRHPPPSPSLLRARRPKDNVPPPSFPRQMNFMEVWWLSVPFAVVLCLILSWLSTGDDDISIHESGIMRVSLRTFPSHPPPFGPLASGDVSRFDLTSRHSFFSYRQSSAREWPSCLYGKIDHDEAQGMSDTSTSHGHGGNIS